MSAEQFMHQTKLLFLLLIVDKPMMEKQCKEECGPVTKDVCKQVDFKECHPVEEIVPKQVKEEVCN